MAENRKVFIPERYLSLSERFTVIELPNLGIGKVYDYSEFNRLLSSGKVYKRVVQDLQFRVLEN